MKILGILGSPRRGGNSETLLDKALEGARLQGAETEKIVLNELKFSPCQECDGCRVDGNCVVEDDMQAVYKMVDDADALIVASPIFFGSLSAQTKMMIDRYQCMWIARFVIKKVLPRKKQKGIFIAAGGIDKGDFFKAARQIVKNFFALLEVKYTGDLFCPEVDKKGDVNKKPKCLKRAFELGRNLAE